MNPILRTTILLAVLLLCLPGTTAARRPPAMSDEQTIAQIEDEFAQAWARRDSKFIERYFSHDSELMWFFERRQLKGFEDVRKLYARMFGATAAGKRTLSNRVIRVYGDAAFSSANFRIESVQGGRRVIDEGRISTFYARQNGQWVAVHRHSSFQTPAGARPGSPIVTGLDDAPPTLRIRRAGRADPER